MKNFQEVEASFSKAYNSVRLAKTEYDESRYSNIESSCIDLISNAASCYLGRYKNSFVLVDANGNKKELCLSNSLQELCKNSLDDVKSIMLDIRNCVLSNKPICINVRGDQRRLTFSEDTLTGRKIIKLKDSFDEYSERDKCREDFQKILQENNITKLYHFTDRNNLESIKKYGLLSWDYCRKNGIPIPRPGGNELSRKLDQYIGMQNYVRLCFVPDHPMLYFAKKRRKNT
jgi:hypothetical protein